MHDDVESGLMALGAEWRGATPHALRLRVAAIADRATNGQVETMLATASRPWLSGRMMALVTAALVVLLLVIPGSRGTIARQAYRVLQTLHIAPGTDLLTFEARSAPEVNRSLRQYQRQLDAGTMWQVHTPYGGWGGTVPPNTSPAVRRIDQVETVRSLATIPLQAPDGVYRGQSLTFHHALISPDGVILTFFGSGNGEILLVQAPVDSGQKIAYSRSVSGSDGIVKSVPPAVETLTLAGQRVTWDPDTTGVNPNLSALRWESAGVSYSLCGRALTKEEAVNLFLSVRPL